MKIGSALAAIVVLVVGLPALAENLVPNGSFEDGKTKDMFAGMDAKMRDYYGGTSQSPFEGWAFGGKWDKGDYTVAVSSDAHTGKQSCQITCAKKGRGGIACSPVKLKAGEIIKVSFWMKAKDAKGGRIFLNFEGSPGDGWASKDLKTGSFDWTKFSQRAVVAGGKSGGEQTIAVFIYSTCEGSVWIDDFTFEKVDVNAIAESPDEPAAGPKRPRAIPEPQGSIGYRVNVVSALEKIFQGDDYAPSVKADKIDIAAARNEYESAQVVIEAPWRPVTVKEVKFSDLTGPGGASIPASALKWERVDYIETTVMPPYFAERGLGSYPDPLMSAGEFTIDKLSRVPVWITLKTPKECPAGAYTGTVTITVSPENLKPTTIPLNLNVWDFALTDQTHLRTLTWLGGGVIRAFYGNQWNAAGDKRQGDIVKMYEDFLLEHRLGPGGEVVAYLNKGKDGYDFKGIDATLERLIGKGMNSFIMGIAPNLRRAGQKEYTEQFVKDFSEKMKAYGDHLRAKGWADKAYVYVYDEAPKSAWPEVKKIDKAIKAAAPEARILQCLNEPEGVKELTGFADVFDVYVTQYHKAGVAESQKKGAEVWLAICCYPMDHPNFFIEYPLLDMRATFWICWKYKVNGFEYWSPNAWGTNWQAKGDKWPKIPWKANAFGRYNGDGYLVYPGPDGPLSSIRFEAFRDGLEDYEYLWTLNDLVTKAEAAKKAGPAVDAARKLLAIDELVKESGAYDTDPAKYVAYRAKMAEAIEKLK
ncbi:MAG: glycoside hydrolase domain-containing protein [Phycisphaerae bacterium]